MALDPSPRPGDGSFDRLLFLPFPLFFFNHAAPSEFYTLSLHDALPTWISWPRYGTRYAHEVPYCPSGPRISIRSEEHTSELQSHSELVCRLLLEKKKNQREIVIMDIAAGYRDYTAQISSPVCIGQSSDE